MSAILIVAILFGVVAVWALIVWLARPSADRHKQRARIYAVSDDVATLSDEQILDEAFKASNSKYPTEALALLVAAVKRAIWCGDSRDRSTYRICDLTPCLDTFCVYGGEPGGIFCKGFADKVSFVATMLLHESFRDGWEDDIDTIVAGISSSDIEYKWIYEEPGEDEDEGYYRPCEPSHPGAYPVTWWRGPNA